MLRLLPTKTGTFLAGNDDNVAKMSLMTMMTMSAKMILMTMMMMSAKMILMTMMTMSAKIILMKMMLTAQEINFFLISREDCFLLKWRSSFTFIKINQANKNNEKFKMNYAV